MRKLKFVVSVITGLFLGQVFAEGESPLKVTNTLRFGYDDNLYRTSSSNSGKSIFVEDTLDFAFRASFSDRTDLLMKSRVTVLSDKSNDFYPNLYLQLSHSVSPRLLMQLSDTFKTGDKTGNFTAANKNRRYNYWRNTIGLNANYVLNEKNRLGASVAHTVERNEQDADTNDFTRISFGASWSRELSPQRTRLIVALQHIEVDYDKQNSSLTMNSLSGKIGHTFNPEWNGYLLGGLTLSEIDRGGTSTTNSSTTSPMFGAGMTYTPSPRTRISSDFSYSYEQTDSTSYGGQTRRELRFGFQHDLTAKIMVKSTIRFLNSQYKSEDRLSTTASARDTSDDRFDWETRLSYKLNRIHFLETGYKYSRKESETSNSWTQNRVDVGWRVEF